MAKHAMSDVVVLLPGVMGSVLRKGDDDIWAPSGGAVWNFFKSRSRSIRDLALDEDDDGSLDDLQDGVKATRLMPDVHLVPKFWSIDGYSKIREALLAGFDLTDKRNYFEFPYDWRRNNRAHGRRLARESATWLNDWKRSSGNDDAKLILIGHSMGGLVGRAFLELEGGWPNTRALITFGTPYQGSLNSLDFVANGFKKGFGPVGVDLSHVLRSLTSTYQLLPTYPCVDDGSAEPVLITEADIPSMDKARAASALRFHTEMADAATAADHRGTDIYPIVGIRQPTLQQAKLDGGQLVLSKTVGTGPAQGDGTVPRRSATPPEMLNLRGTMYSAVEHGSLQNAEAVLAHLEGVLTQQSFLPAAQADMAAYLTLDLDDYFAVDEPIEARIQCSEFDATMDVVVVDSSTGTTVKTSSIDNLDGEDWQLLALNPLPAGTYRLTVSAPEVDAPDLNHMFIVWE